MAILNITYQGQSGALNESWSDVFGTLVDWRSGVADAAHRKHHRHRGNQVGAEFSQSRGRTGIFELGSRRRTCGLGQSLALCSGHRRMAASGATSACVQPWRRQTCR